MCLIYTFNQSNANKKDQQAQEEGKIGTKTMKAKDKMKI